MTTLSISRMQSHQPRRKRAGRTAQHRRVFFEQLEDRRLLAGDWHNPLVPVDVDGDRRVAPVDALRIINKLKADGSFELPDLAAGEQPEAYYDTDDDGFVAPRDVLLVINAIIADERGFVLTDLTSLSRHYIQATFDEPAAGALFSPDAYMLTGPDASQLKVMSVAEGEAPNQVILETATPAAGDFTVSFDPDVTAAISRVASFKGVPGDETILETAIALDNTSVLLTFSDPLEFQTADVKEFFRIVAANDDVPARDVGGVEINDVTAEGRTVILHTSPMENIQYQVKATNQLDDIGGPKNGKRLIDPTQNTANFFGIPQSDGLQLTSAVSTGDTTILLSFSEPIAEVSVNASNFFVTSCPIGEPNCADPADVLITGVEVSDQGTRVTLKTEPQRPGLTFEVTAIDLRDRLGNLIDPNPSTTVVVVPVPIADRTGPPVLTNAVSTGDTTIMLTFNEPIDPEGVNTTNFSVTYCPLEDKDCANPSVLVVTDVAFHDEGTRIELTTLPQPAGVEFEVTVNGLLDLAGNLIDENVDPTTVVIPVPVSDRQGPPTLTNAISTSETTVLLTFDEPIDSEGVNATNFATTYCGIDDTCSDPPELVVESATLLEFGTRVELTTRAQPAGNVFTVTVADVRDLAGNSIDANGDSKTFTVDPVDTTPPVFNSVVAVDPTTVLLSFNERLADDAADPIHFSIVDPSGTPLVITDGGLNPFGTQVILTTGLQTPQVQYTIAATGVADQAGNILNSASRTFSSAAVPVDGNVAPEDLPSLVGAASLNNTAIRVQFSELMGKSALEPDNYRLTIDGQEAGGLQIPHQLTAAVSVQQEPGVGHAVSMQPDTFFHDPLPDSDLVAINTASGSGVTVIDGESGEWIVDLTNAAGGRFKLKLGENETPELDYDVTSAELEYEISQLTAKAPVRWLGDDHSVVEIAVQSQSELTYRLTVFNLRDVAGNPFPERPFLNISKLLVEPNSVTFTGRPPSGAFIDSDEDGVSDSREQRGYVIQIQQADGTVLTQTVTSDPLSADTDQDGVDDFDERHFLSNPREPDTDHDSLTDDQELNEIYSDPFNQDTDGDGLTDGLEFNFFRTSPLLADTDGDQISDDQEITANRNPRVADLPAPRLEVGDLNLTLDVRFTETTSDETRDLETRQVTSTLTRSDNREFENMDSSVAEVMASFELSAEAGFENLDSPADKPFFLKFHKQGGGLFANIGTSVAASTTNTTTNQFTTTSVLATENAFEDSLTTDFEVTEGSESERAVEGARIQTSITINMDSDVAFAISDLQVTAFTVDPIDPGKLTPIATLLPDNEPDSGFTLGPLVDNVGPIIFSSDEIFPDVVERLMQNPRGIMFKISNYSISYEDGRDFAFVSQEVEERTTGLIIDYGGFDSDGDGVGDFTDIFRVATSAGRPLEDTNGDQRINDEDDRVSFDGKGKEVGITLRDTLEAIGLTHYTIDDFVVDEQAGRIDAIEQERDAEGTLRPVGFLTDAQLQNSYSTYRTENLAGEPVEVIYRIRETTQVRSLVSDANGNTVDDDGDGQPDQKVEKFWAVLTQEGLIESFTLDGVIQANDSDTRLALVKDSDNDQIEARVEFLLGTSDSGTDDNGDGIADGRDTDLDGLDDRFEYAIGWTVDTALGQVQVFTSPTSPDSDRDGLMDWEEAPVPYEGEIRWIDVNFNKRFDDNDTLEWADRNGDGLIDNSTSINLWYDNPQDESLFTETASEEMRDDLDAGILPSAIKDKTGIPGFPLSDESEVGIVEAGSYWQIIDSEQEMTFIVKLEDSLLNVYKTGAEPVWEDSRAMELDAGNLTQDMRDAFEREGQGLSDAAVVTVDTAGERWGINDQVEFSIRRDGDTLLIEQVTPPPSEPGPLFSLPVDGPYGRNPETGRVPLDPSRILFVDDIRLKDEALAVERRSGEEIPYDDIKHADRNFDGFYSSRLDVEWTDNAEGAEDDIGKPDPLDTYKYRPREAWSVAHHVITVKDKPTIIYGRLRWTVDGDDVNLDGVIDFEPDDTPEGPFKLLGGDLSEELGALNAERLTNSLKKAFADLAEQSSNRALRPLTGNAKVIVPRDANEKPIKNESWRIIDQRSDYTLKYEFDADCLGDTACLNVYINGIPTYDEVRIIDEDGSALRPFFDDDEEILVGESTELSWNGIDDNPQNGKIDEDENEDSFIWIDRNDDGFVNIDRLTGRVDGLIDRDELSNIAGADIIPYQITTNPLEKDTDSDGVTDIDEIFGFEIDLRVVPPEEDVLIKVVPEDVDPDFDDLRFFVGTNPTDHDTDGDTGSDGLEQQLGGNPNKKELGDFVDADQDGLVNIQERGDTRRDGVVVTYEGIDWFEFGDSISAELREINGDNFTIDVGQDDPELDESFDRDFDLDFINSVKHINSDFNNPDSDNDGLRDGEEYLLGTNPVDDDTDGDGLSDLLEVRGFELDHKVNGVDLGIIKLNPLDADTDNDLIPDGEEVVRTKEIFIPDPDSADGEREITFDYADYARDTLGIPAQRWIVRVKDGRTEPYEVFTDPRVADSDLDDVVDGHEKYKITFTSTDINKRNKKPKTLVTRTSLGTLPFLGTDPHNYDTDGDGLSDKEDISDDGEDPLTPLIPKEPFYEVSVEFVHLALDSGITDDGDGGASGHLYSQEFGPGEFEVEAWLRKPDRTSEEESDPFRTWEKGACLEDPFSKDRDTDSPCTEIIDSNALTPIGYASPEYGIFGAAYLNQGSVEDFEDNPFATITGPPQVTELLVDLDDDFDLDRVVAKSNDDELIIEIKENGDIEETKTIEMPEPVDVIAAHLNEGIDEDSGTFAGPIDLIVANKSSGKVSVLLDFDGDSPDVFTRHDIDVGVAPTHLVAADFNRDGNTDFAVSTEDTVKIMANDGMGGFIQIQAVTMPINPLTFSPFTREIDRIQPGALMVTELPIPLLPGFGLDRDDDSSIDPVQFLNVFSRPVEDKVLPGTVSAFTNFYDVFPLHCGDKIDCPVFGVDPPFGPLTSFTGVIDAPNTADPTFEIKEDEQFLLEAVVREHDGQVGFNFFYVEDRLGGPSGKIKIGQKEFPSSVITGRQVADVYADGGFALLTFEFEGGSEAGGGSTSEGGSADSAGTGIAYSHNSSNPFEPRRVRTDNNEWPAGKLVFSMTVKKIDPNVSESSNNLVADSIGSNSTAQPLNEDQIQPLLAEAIDRLGTTGAADAELRDTQVQIVDLPGATLGQAIGNVIYLDRNAAGHGWFVDSTPWDDLEFTTAGDQGEQDRIDALTVITHELGHILGLAHDDHGVMQPTLAAGERHLRDATDLLDDETLDALVAAWEADKVH